MKPLGIANKHKMQRLLKTPNTLNYDYYVLAVSFFVKNDKTAK